MTTAVVATGAVYRVPSKTTPGVSYTVLVGLDGQTQCNCAGYEHHGDCWHCKYVKEESMTTALTTIKVAPPPTVLPTESDWQSMDRAVAYLAENQSIAIPSNLKTKQDVRAVILAGWEIGVKPMTALRHIMVVNGKTEPDGQLMAGILQAKEPDARFEITEDTDEATTVRLTRPSKNLIREYRVTNDDAKRAGLLGKAGPWSQYPRDMRRWHAVKRLCRAYAPDVINGIASVALGDLPDTMADVEPEGDFIDGEIAPVQDIASDLYNEGDEPEDVAPISPDELPEGVTNVRGQTEPQRGAIVDLQEGVKGKHGDDALVEIVRAAKERWPYAVDAENGRFKTGRLTEEDSAAYIQILREKYDAKRGAPTQPSLTP